VPRPPIPVLLLPGLEGSSHLFRRFLGAATGALDLRPLPFPQERPLGYAELADHVRAAMPRRPPWILLGESFSGPMALLVAREAPRGLAGVVLAASFHRQPAPRWIERLRPLARVFFTAPLPAHAVRLLLGGPDAPDELVREVQEAVAGVPARVMLRRAHEALAVDATADLLSCPVPVLVLSGQHDRLLRRQIPSEIRALRRDAEVRLLDAPHLVLQRQPAEAMRLLESFARRVCGEPSPGGDGAPGGREGVRAAPA